MYFSPPLARSTRKKVTSVHTKGDDGGAAGAGEMVLCPGVVGKYVSMQELKFVRYGGLAGYSVHVRSAYKCP